MKKIVTTLAISIFIICGIISCIFIYVVIDTTKEIDHKLDKTTGYYISDFKYDFLTDEISISSPKIDKEKLKVLSITETADKIIVKTNSKSEVSDREHGKIHYQKVSQDIKISKNKKIVVLNANNEEMKEIK